MNKKPQIAKAHFMCPSPYKIGDVIMVEKVIYPSWWQLWKKPIRVIEKNIVASVFES